ncbi:hypothetical protein ASD19_01610 [Microbacterium sp. Root53]|uniref:hypothetical protein n=1 Tax=Microbacterium sp. Root53 TaxID=1736553 RepID=UPI0006FB1226|nr:hypothetical protein [Microbacterium sp. Root53]KQZ11979.1 hypothetical protein ASD19_01610 [Microbacterium sp. Root53]
MPRSPKPLPERLRGRAFRRDEAAEVSDARLRRGDLWSPARGVRLPVARDGADDILRARALLIPEGGAYSHTSAAHLHRIPLPHDRDGVAVVHVTTPRGTRARRGRGVVGHQRRLVPDDVVVLHGAPCTRLLRTFCDLADVLTFAELVAVGDWIVGRGATGVMPARILEAIGAAELAAGRRDLLRHVVARLNPLAESPKESELRVLLEDAGFAGLVCQHRVFDRGEFVARIDLAIPGLRVAIEYEGDHHRDQRQWRRDMQRRRRLEALGWIYIPVSQADLEDPSRVIADVAAAIRSRA